MSLQTLVSTLEQRALLTYVAPQFLGNPKLSLQLSGLFDRSHNIRTFSSQREEGSIQLAQKLSKADTLQYRFTYRKVNILGTPLVSPELIPLLSQPVRVGFLSMSFIQDKRDDPIDSHRGTYTSIDLALASHASLDRRPVSGEWWRAIPPTTSSPRIWCWREPRISASLNATLDCR